MQGSLAVQASLVDIASELQQGLNRPYISVFDGVV